MNKTRVRLKGASYDVLICDGEMNALGRALRNAGASTKIIAISDYNVGRLYGQVLRHCLRSSGFKVELLLVPPGEKQKSLKNAEKLYHALASLKASKDSSILSFGGGVIGDLTGFVAATYMRGIRLVHVPTTLLAMVDSGIGGKTGVNLDEGKNLVGSFYQPSLVFCDVSHILTLPEKEMRNGLSEIIKYGVIKDPQLFALLEKHVKGLKNPRLDRPKDFKGLMHLWVRIIERSASIKARIVEQDEKEQKGPRMLLNFGHTVGHALESLMGYSGISHGEAVAVGMAAASRAALKLRMLRSSDLDRIISLIEAVNLSARIPKKLKADDIISRLILDKKVRNGKLNFVLPRFIGSAVIRNDVPVRTIREALKDTGAK
ncbi:MAG: 3-dehydroquinate synthase [Candidatus Margulisiibacteriota bacterium]